MPGWRRGECWIPRLPLDAPVLSRARAREAKDPQIESTDEEILRVH
jgi:hypothetical protein